MPNKSRLEEPPGLCNRSSHLEGMQLDNIDISSETMIMHNQRIERRRRHQYSDQIMGREQRHADQQG